MIEWREMKSGWLAGLIISCLTLSEFSPQTIDAADQQRPNIV